MCSVRARVLYICVCCLRVYVVNVRRRENGPNCQRCVYNGRRKMREERKKAENETRENKRKKKPTQGDHKKTNLSTSWQIYLHQIDTERNGRGCNIIWALAAALAHTHTHSQKRASWKETNRADRHCEEAATAKKKYGTECVDFGHGSHRIVVRTTLSILIMCMCAVCGFSSVFWAKCASDRPGSFCVCLPFPVISSSDMFVMSIAIFRRASHFSL